MKLKHELSNWALEDIKRLVKEAERGEDGQMPVVRDRNHYVWIGAAHAHLKMLLESAEHIGG